MERDLVQIVVADDEEAYRLFASPGIDGWYANLSDESTEMLIVPPCVYEVRRHGPYSTPYACLEALFRVVVTELFGVRA